MSDSKSFRKPTRTGNRLPAYKPTQPDSETGPALSANQLPLDEELDPSVFSAATEAEALGTDTSSLLREVHDEESQRHAGVHDDDEDANGIAALAEAFHRRLGDRS